MKKQISVLLTRFNTHVTLHDTITGVIFLSNSGPSFVCWFPCDMIKMAATDNSLSVIACYCSISHFITLQEVASWFLASMLLLSYWLLAPMRPLIVKNGLVPTYPTNNFFEMHVYFLKRIFPGLFFMGQDFLEIGVGLHTL